MIAHNANYLIRTYPKGTRVDSSNFNPVPYWEMGIQMVTLNFQTSSLPMWINVGKFRENSCGYLLKPQYMRTSVNASARKWAGGTAKPLLPKKPEPAHSKLTIRIFGARQLPKIKDKSSLDPFVEVILSTEEKDTVFRTPSVKENGFNPQWNAECCFDLKDDGYVTFVIRDDSPTIKRPICHYSVPTHCLCL